MTVRPLDHRNITCWLTTLEAVENRLAELPFSANRDPLLKLQLPQDDFLESFCCDQTRPSREHCTYTLNLASHALRHASGLLSLLSIPLVGHQLVPNAPPSFQEIIPWLIDAAVRMNVTQNTWRELSRSSLSQYLRSTINILDIMKRLVNADMLVEEKAYMSLVHLCADVLMQRQAVFGLESAAGVDGILLSVAVVKISEACLSFTTVSRLVSSQIIPMLEKPMSYENITPTETDLWVSPARSLAITVNC